MQGLRIRTVTGQEFVVRGAVAYKAEYDSYYCAGESFPAEIVTEVIQ